MLNTKTKRTLVRFGINCSVLCLLVSGCEEAPVESSGTIQIVTHSVPTAKTLDTYLAIDLENRLKHFAKAVAKALEVPEVASYLKQEIAKKFDGDFDALWENVKDQSFPGKGSLRDIISKNLEDLNDDIDFMADVENVPKLQVSLPVHFQAWDGVTPIKVAYTPLTIDDIDVQEVLAYDRFGEEYVLDGKTPPEFPVMVVGINERTDDEGNVTYGALALSYEGRDGGGTPVIVAYPPSIIHARDAKVKYAYGGSGEEYPFDAQTASDPPVQVVGINKRAHEEGLGKLYFHGKESRELNDPEILEHVYLIDDKEPFFKGSPEIYFVVMNPDGFYLRLNKYNEWTGWGTNQGWHQLDVWLFDWHSDFGSQYLMWIWEADGNATSTERTITAGGVTYSFMNDAHDDQLGARTVYFLDLYKTKTNPYFAGDAKFTVRFW